MPVPTNLESAATWTSGAAIMAWLGTMLVRFLTKTFRADRLEAATTGAEVAGYERLQKEIERLARKCEQLEDRLNRLRDSELEDAADIASLSILIQQMPCGKCQYAEEDIFGHAKLILAMMIKRKKETQEAIKATQPADGK